MCPGLPGTHRAFPKPRWLSGGPDSGLRTRRAPDRRHLGAGVEISRDDLYAAVWRAPMKHLAVEFDVPVDQLVRACRELAVPRPVQGHWPLVSLGKHPGVRPLPPAPVGTPSHARLQRAIQAARLIRPPRKAPSTETHPILELTRDALAKAKADERGRLVLPAGRRLLNVRVTAAQRDRAVAILDAVIRSFATVDATLDVQRIRDGAPFTSRCLIDGETIEFRLEEWVRSKLRPPAPGEKLAWHQLFRGQVRTFEPTGMLTLELDFEEGSHVRRRWEDSANVPSRTSLPVESHLRFPVADVGRRPLACPMAIGSEAWDVAGTGVP